MPDFEYDEIQHKGTVWLHKAGVDHSRVINGTTVGFDPAGTVVNLVFPAVDATMNLSGIPLSAPDVVAVKNLMSHTARFAKKVAGA